MPYNLNANRAIEPFLYHESSDLVEKAVANAREFSCRELSKDSLTCHVFSVTVDEHCVAVQTAIAPTTLSDFPGLSFHSYSIRYRLCCQAIRALQFKSLIEEATNAVHFATHRTTFLRTECLEDDDSWRPNGTPKQDCFQIANEHLLGYITKQDKGRCSDDGNAQQYRSGPTTQPLVPNNPTTPVVEGEGGFQQTVAGSLVVHQNASNRRTGASEAILGDVESNSNSGTPWTNGNRGLISDDDSDLADHLPIGQAICKCLSKLEKRDGLAFTKASDSSRLRPGEYAEKAMDLYDQYTSASKGLQSSAKTQVWQFQHLAFCFLMSAQALDTRGAATEKINRRIKDAERRQGKKPTSTQWLSVVRNKTVMANQLVCSMIKIWGFPKALGLYCALPSCHRRLGKVARQNSTKRTGFVRKIISYLQESEVNWRNTMEPLYNPSEIVREALNIDMASSQRVAIDTAIGFFEISQKQPAPPPVRRSEDSGSTIIPDIVSWSQKSPAPALQTGLASCPDLFASLQPGYEWHHVNPEPPSLWPPTETASSHDLFSSLQPGYQWSQTASEPSQSWPQTESNPDLYSPLQPGHEWPQTGLGVTAAWSHMDLSTDLNLCVSEHGILAN